MLTCPPGHGPPPGHFSSLLCLAHGTAHAAFPGQPHLRGLFYHHRRDRLALDGHPHDLAGSHAEPLHAPHRLLAAVARVAPAGERPQPRAGDDLVVPPGPPPLLAPELAAADDDDVAKLASDGRAHEGKGLEAGVLAGRRLAAEHDGPPCPRVQGHVEPPGAGDHGAGKAEVPQADVVAGHRGDTTRREGCGAEDVDQGVQQEGRVPGRGRDGRQPLDAHVGEGRSRRRRGD